MDRVYNICMRAFVFSTYRHACVIKCQLCLCFNFSSVHMDSLNIQERPVSRLGLRSTEERLLVSLTPRRRMWRGRTQYLAVMICRQSISLGPVLILLASNFLVSMFTGYLESLAVIIGAGLAVSKPQLVFYLLSPVIGYAALSLFYPCTVWLVDTYCGRRKAMQVGLVLILVPSLFTSISLLVFLGPQLEISDVFNIWHKKKIPPQALRAMEGIAIVCLCCLFIGLLIFRSGVVQLGADKLDTLTPTKTSWFAHWLLWTDYAGRQIPYIYVITSFFGSGSVKGYFIAFILMMTLLCVLTSLKCLQCTFNRCYCKEPKSDNQCFVICRVLHHGRKNSRLRERWETAPEGEEPTSFLDAAKVQFGGPFNSIQVERVKASLSVFLRVVAIAFSSGLSVCAQGFLPLLSRIMDSTSDLAVDLSVSCDLSPGMCLDSITKRISGFGNFSNLFLILLIPFMCPILAKTVTSSTSLKKLGIGLALLVASILCSFVMDVVSSFQHQGPVCAFNFPLSGEFAETYNTSAFLLILQNVLNAFSVLFTYTASLEFVLLNAPVPLRSTLLCALFCLQGVFALLGVLVLVPFSLHFGSTDNLPRFPPCTLGYYIINLLVAIVLLVVFMICARTYEPPAYIGSNPLEVSSSTDQREENEVESSVV